ncbi:hypothetical protein HDC30_002396 [Pseudomonas sp. JAI115]|nr:hypothetical protein [Pseudomonas sp. JAI115]
MFDTQPLLSAPAHLLLHFDRLTEQMRGKPAPWFKQDEHAPDYELARDSGWRDAFIHVRRDGPSHGGFVGDKLHLSVEREQVPQAFKAIAGLLLGDACPIDERKVTGLQRVAPAIGCTSSNAGRKLSFCYVGETRAARPKA